MPHQLNDQQYYAIQAALDRVRAELEQAYALLYGQQAPPQCGAAPTKPNPGGKQFAPPTPPTVTSDHQAALDAADPEKQAEKAAEESVSQAALKGTIDPNVLVISASANGQGDYYALVQCRVTMQQASIVIEEYEYEELKSVSAEDNFSIELSQEQVDEAEWEPMRGTSTDPQGQCNCMGHTPKANPYNDPKVDAEIAAGHIRKCRFWDYNTITYDQNTGVACHVELDKFDASCMYGFDPYNEARKAMLKRAADPEDAVVLNHGDDGEFDVQTQLIGTVTTGGLEDDDDGC